MARHSVHCGGFFSSRQPRQRQHGDVVVLAELHSGLGGLGGAWVGREEGFQAVKAVELSGRIARFEQAIGIKGHPVPDLDVEDCFLVAGCGREAERKGAGQAEFVAIEEERRMAGAGNRATAIEAKAQGDAGGEAALHAAVEAAVKLRKQLGRPGIVVRQHTDSAHDERYGHGGFESLAADVAQNHQRSAACGRVAFDRNDLEEIAAHLLCWAVRAGKSKTGNGRQRSGDQQLLEFAGALELLLKSTLAPAAVG